MSERAESQARESDIIVNGGRSGVPVRSALFVGLAFAGLLTLIATTILATRTKVQAVYTELDEANMLHRHVDGNLRRLRSDIHLSGIFVRDYLLDSSVSAAPDYREQLTALREGTTQTIEEIERSVGPRHKERMDGLRSKLEDYWAAFGPLFDWTPEEKAYRSSYFLRREVLPRREAVLEIAKAIEEINNENTLIQRESIAGRERELHAYMNRMLLMSLLVGALVSIGTVFRIQSLEKRSEAQQLRAEHAEDEMRRLSHQLVHTHEEERRSLSRELHDQVGQLLTGLRMELGKLEKARDGDRTRFSEHADECKRLVDSLIDTVRHLSMGLRPSMLDDLGLQPAIEWQARDFARRYDVPVNVKLDGALDAIKEPHRTTVYRVVQEALTNCAKHADANQISVSLRRYANGFRLLVQDDGVGLRGVADSVAGLGLLGIKERVREIGGQMTVHSTQGAGTTLEIEVPYSFEEESDAVTNSAG
jgi:signal transduction histidine kinase